MSGRNLSGVYHFYTKAVRIIPHNHGIRLVKMVATKWLRLGMETDEESKARLEKMIATTQLRLALETEEERRAKNGLDMIWI